MEGNAKSEQIVDVGSVVEAVSADDGDAPLYSLESLCMRCGENGITRFLLTLIPHFRKILLSAFECPHCGERNNEVQFAGEIQPRGCRYTLAIPSGKQKMLNRQVVKSESATIKIPELDFEIPPEAQRGSLSTISEALGPTQSYHNFGSFHMRPVFCSQDDAHRGRDTLRAADELQALQEERKKVAPETAEAIDQFLVKLQACATGESAITFILDDPAGNSFIENPFAPSSDPSSTIKFYERTPEQQASLGYLVDSTQIEGTHVDAQSNSAEMAEALFRYTAPEEVMTFPSTCGACAAKCETRMFVTSILWILRFHQRLSVVVCQRMMPIVNIILSFYNWKCKLWASENCGRDTLRAADELQALQEERKKVAPETAEAIDQFLVKLQACATGESAITFILDDPAGNSFIENPFAPSSDPSSTIKFYERTPEQQASLGYLVDSTQIEGTHVDAQSNSAEMAEALFRYTAPEEVMTFPSTCGACAAKCETRMFVTNIPYFQEVIVMASTCDVCGYRNSELKPGGRIPEKGKTITLSVKNVNDLSRDVIKSDTASVKVPELDLELASGTLGGIVTTVEGLITRIGDSLERVHGFTFGDSLDENSRSKWIDFKTRLNKLLSLEEAWTLILDDALANSFIAPATDDLKEDKQLAFEEYERSWEQNEELGLNDMDTSSAEVGSAPTNTSKTD
ncbi:zinc finger protein [Vigna unguiculata]|uniref:Zinc finger protein n=1 Tax=Vigna unguiculata TaxID=3917 RepID=A0A4D6L2X2_VIGUN|nr:zinc finger protein [Vigna unguiculata]